MATQHIVSRVQGKVFELARSKGSDSPEMDVIEAMLDHYLATHLAPQHHDDFAAR